MNRPVIGWDVGGANIKAVRLEADGARGLPLREAAGIERPFALWRAPQRLSQVLAEVAAALGGAPSDSVMAVTMTGELADCFPTRSAGVEAILDAFGAAFSGTVCRVYGLDGRFRTVAEALREPLAVAAANWAASAALAARVFPDAILLDAGSTTTDVIPIVAGAVAAEGRSDTERLASGELVYTGALRTPVCAVVRSVRVGGRACRVAAEVFAIAADAHRWLGSIGEGAYSCETPDGRGRGREAAGQRLARMVGADLDALDPDEITAVAQRVARAQVRQIAAGIRQVRRRLGPRAPSAALVSGAGAFLARAAAEAAGLECLDPADRLGEAAARLGPAAAVAYLLMEAPGGAGA